MQAYDINDEVEALKNYKLEPVSGIAYVDRGNSEQTLLLIHGLGSNRYAWLGNFIELSKSYRCIAIDLPNYGSSRKGNFSFSMEFFKDKVIQFCNELSLNSVTLIGHSMGAQIAVLLAVEKPSIFKNLILLAPAGIEIFNKFEKQWFKQINKPELLFSAREEQIKNNFETNFYHFGPEAKWMLKERLEFMQDKVSYFNYCEMICTCVFEMLEAPVKDHLHKILQASLVLFGGDDQLIPNKLLHSTMSINNLVEDAKKLIPLAEVKKISQAGHFVHTHQKEKVNEEIINFIKSAID